MSNWIKKMNDTSEKIDVEAFAKNARYEIVEKTTPYLAQGKRASGGKKVNYPLRMEEHISEMIDKECDTAAGKNSVINLLLEFALNELKSRNKTIVSK